MKKLKLISLFIFLTSMFACEPSVTFSEPQPVNKNNLSKIPISLQGQYISSLDSSTLSIDEKLMQRVYDYHYKVHPNQLNDISRLVGDTVFDIETNERTLIKREGDSLLIYTHYVDTLFQMDHDNVVRKFKGYYFLNNRYDKDSWEVKKIEILQGQLVISSVSTKFDLENLKEITDTTLDTIPPYNFTTTKRQFKKFIKNDGFSDDEIFIKQKKNLK